MIDVNVTHNAYWSIFSLFKRIGMEKNEHNEPNNFQIEEVNILFSIKLYNDFGDMVIDLK